MDARFEPMMEQYRHDYEGLRILKDFVMKKLQEIVDESNIEYDALQGRVKTESSLAGKFDRKGYKYRDIHDITDLVGVRVITYYADAVDKVAKLVEETFTIDWDNSVDARLTMAADTFGYLSLHYVCKIPESLFSDVNHPEINEYRFEVQMRSALQHVWAAVEHDMGYKSDIQVPKEYLRAYSRLAGLLELADIEFERIRDGIEGYRKDIRVLYENGRLDKIQLNQESLDLYLESMPFEELTERIRKINNMEVQKGNNNAILRCFNLLGLETLADVNRMLHEDQDLAYEFARKQFEGTDLDIMSSTMPIRNLCVIEALRQNMDFRGLVNLYKAFGASESSARRHAQKALEYRDELIGR